MLGFGLPALEMLGKTLELTAAARHALFLLGLVALFFVPTLLFVVGLAHLDIRSAEAPKAVYWASLRQVGARALVWLVGCGIGFAILSVRA